MKVEILATIFSGLTVLFTAITAYYQYMNSKPTFYLKLIKQYSKSLFFELVIENTSKHPLQIMEIKPIRPFNLRICSHKDAGSYKKGYFIFDNEPSLEELDINLVIDPGEKCNYKFCLSVENEFLIEPSVITICLQTWTNSLLMKHKIIELKSKLPVLTSITQEETVT